MATLVLTAVGTMLGGPIGGAIGALVGSQADAMIFAPKGRRGPRLGDLAIQTSSYGSPIPRIFGTMRVAGSVIWATDLIESRSSSGGGKGKPKTTSYSYSASFAVALSGRRIRAVRRIWADGKLLRGAAGDFKSQTGFRLYLGGEDQRPDPRIAATEGTGQAPAHRGTAYAMFEDFQLADYGNRIPSLTFEVEADAAPVAIGTIAEALSAGAVVDGGTPTLGGYAAGGDSVRGAIEALGDIVSFSLSDDGDVLTLTSASGTPLVIADAEEGARGIGDSGGRTELARRAAGSLADAVTVAYHDAARDYQTGLQRATRGGAAARAEELALPAALAPGRAKAIAEARLSAIWTGRVGATVHLPWRRAMIRPGQCLTIPGQGGFWKVRRWTLDHMVVSLELEAERSGPMPDSSEASPGRSTREPDVVHGPTTLRLLDLPLPGERPADAPTLLAMAAGVEAGWRKAALLLSLDGGASWEETGGTAAPAVMGQALTALRAGGAALFATVGSVDVELLHGAMWLEARHDEALVGGANLALLGDELIQFGSAVPIGERRFRLSRLLRGRFGTEWAGADHAAGDAFILIDPQVLAAIGVPLARMGGSAMLMASGIGDVEPAVVDRMIEGEALRPPGPVHLKCQQRDGDLAISWVRRSRSGWAWLDGGDAPLAEEAERYLLSLAGPGFERTIVLAEPAYLYTAPQRASDGVSGTLTVAVAQIGTFGPSRAVRQAVTFQT